METISKSGMYRTSIPLSVSSQAHSAHCNVCHTPRDVDLNSDRVHLDVPRSDGSNLLAVPAPSDEPDEICTIWGTAVNLAETSKLFPDFFKGFKPKYWTSYDHNLGLRARSLSSLQEEEALLYDMRHFWRMQQTGETKLNLDVVNLLAYPL